MSGNQQFEIPIPSGWRIFFPEMEVAGLNHRKNQVLEVLKMKEFSIEMEAEPDNEYDENAIKVVALKDGFFGKKKVHFGYIPKGIAAKISESDVLDELAPRMKEIWVGDKGGVSIKIDIVGPKNVYRDVFPE